MLCKANITPISKNDVLEDTHGSSPVYSYSEVLHPYVSEKQFQNLCLRFAVEVMSPGSASSDLQEVRERRHSRHSLYLFICSCHHQQCLFFREEKLAAIPYFQECVSKLAAIPSFQEQMSATSSR